MQVILDNLPYFIQSFGWTILYSFATLIGATVIGGSVAATTLVFDHRVLRRFVSVLVNVIRGLPLLVVLFATYFILPFFGIDLPKVVAALLGLTVFFSASLAEVFRAAFQSVPKIQSDVAKALGLDRWARMRHVTMPLARKLIVGPLIGEFVRIVKGSTLLSLLAIPELMMAGREVTTATFKGIEIYGTIGLMYFLFIFFCSRAGQKLESKHAFDH